MMDIMMANATPYMKHYIDLESQYICSMDIYKKFDEELKKRIHEKAEKGGYKFQMYLRINPLLERSPYLRDGSPSITRFRLGSHYLPIEKGRW